LAARWPALSSGVGLVPTRAEGAAAGLAAWGGAALGAEAFAAIGVPGVLDGWVERSAFLHAGMSSKRPVNGSHLRGDVRGMGGHHSGTISRVPPGLTGSDGFREPILLRWPWSTPASPEPPPPTTEHGSPVRLSSSSHDEPRLTGKARSTPADAPLLTGKGCRTPARPWPLTGKHQRPREDGALLTGKPDVVHGTCLPPYR
jgi:hypothetical protein